MDKTKLSPAEATDGLWSYTRGDIQLALVGVDEVIFNRRNKQCDAIATVLSDIDYRLAILFVEQNVEVIRSLADRCYAMERGRIVDELDAKTLDEREAVAEYLAV